MANAMMPGQVTGQLSKVTSLRDQIDAVRSMCKGSSGSNKFAETLVLLSEVTTQLAELDETCRQAALAGENEKAEARKWREISASTMKFAQASLLEQQIRAIEVLQDLSMAGCSITNGPEQNSGETHASMSSKVITKSFSPMNSKTASNEFFAPPPGLSAPPGFESPAVAGKQSLPLDMSAHNGACSILTTPSPLSINTLNLDAYDDSDSD